MWRIYHTYPLLAIRSSLNTLMSTSRHSSPGRDFASDLNSWPLVCSNRPLQHFQIFNLFVPVALAADSIEQCHFHTPVLPCTLVKTVFPFLPLNMLFAWKWDKFSAGDTHSKLSAELFPLSRSLWLTCVEPTHGGGPRNENATNRCTATTRVGTGVQVILV